MIPDPLCSNALNCPVAECCARDDRHYRKDDIDRTARTYRFSVWTVETGCQRFLQYREKRMP